MKLSRLEIFSTKIIGIIIAVKNLKKNLSMKNIITLIFTLFVLTGISQKTAQDRAEDVVKAHLIKTFTAEKYKSYGFEELFKVSPPRILEVESLKSKIDKLRKNNLLTDSSLKHYDSILKLKVDTIKGLKEFSYYDIKHYYVIKDAKKNHLYFTQFFLFPDGKIKDVTQLMKYEFVGKEYDWFYNYYRRNPMLPNNIRENKKCFQYLDNLLENETFNRESTMATVINTYSVISTKQFLDTTVLTRLLSMHWLKKNNDTELTINQFSDVSPILDSTETIGYKLFVKYENAGVEKVQYFEFDLNYILSNSLPVEKPFEQYFKKEK